MLGVELGEKFNFSGFITNKMRTCNFHLRNFKQIKYCLPRKTRILLVNNFIFSTLDVCNSLLVCAPNYQIQILQKIMNKAVRFILDVRFDEHMTPFLCQLHFLPVKFRIKFKICLIAFKIVQTTAPQYLIDNFKMFKPNCNITLRLGKGRDTNMMEINLDQQKKNTIYTQIILEWNKLPLNIRSISELHSFKKQLKTYLFKTAFENLL